MRTPDKDRWARLPGLSALAAALVLAMAFGAAGCGDEDDASEGGSGAAASEPAEEREGVSLGLELVGGGDFINETTAGAEQAASDLGPVELDINMPPPGLNPVVAQKHVTDMLAKRPDALGIAPLPPDAWRRTLQTVTEQVDHTLATLIKPAETPDNAGSALLKTYVGVNDIELGRAAVRATAEAAGLGEDTTGTALLGQCVPGTTGTLYERAEGFRQGLAEVLPNVEAKTFDSKPTPQENTNAWESMLQANPNPTLAIGTCDIDGASLYQLKRRSGADFPAGALETAPDTLRGLKNGTIDAAVAVNWWMSGYATVRLLADAARGGEVPAGWIDTGFTVVGRDNAEEIETRDSSAAEAEKWYAARVEQLFADLQAKPLEDAWK